MLRIAGEGGSAAAVHQQHRRETSRRRRSGRNAAVGEHPARPAVRQRPAVVGQRLQSRHLTLREAGGTVRRHPEKPFRIPDRGGRVAVAPLRQQQSRELHVSHEERHAARKAHLAVQVLPDLLRRIHVVKRDPQSE